MVNFSESTDDWVAGDETSYDNPSNYDPDAYDPDDPTGDGDNSYAADEVTDHDFQDPEEAIDSETPPAKDPIEPLYENVFDWVDGFFMMVIRRKINPSPGTGLSWDQRWWLYPEVVARLTALHYAWEEARASDKPSAMSSWWIHHLEPHIRVIFDGETGPMSHADTAGSWSGWPALEGEAVPEELRSILLGEDDTHPEN